MASEKNRPFYSSDFQSYCSNAKKLVDTELQALLPAIAELKLRKQIEYALQTSGKRLRPTLVLLSGESVGGNRMQLRKLALAFELLHLATLVHDDILDEDVVCRNALSVYAKWSVKDADFGGRRFSFAFAVSVQRVQAGNPKRDDRHMHAAFRRRIQRR